MILLVALCVVACGGSDNTKETTAASTSADTVTTTTAVIGTTEGTVDTTATVITTATTTEGVVSTAITTSEGTPTVTTAPSGELYVSENHTAVLNDKEWVVEGADTSKFDMFGTGATIVTKISAAYNGYKKSYYTLDENGNKVTIANNEIKKLGTVGVTVTVDKTAKTCDALITPLDIKVQSSWLSVNARAGTYVMFEFTTNLQVEFVTTVTLEEGGATSSAAYKSETISVSGKDGTYTGTAKCQIPYAEGKSMYINICLSGGVNESIVSIPLNITPSKYESPFKLKIEGDWELIERKDYVDDLIELFYNVYPRLYARFGLDDPNVPMTITFKADKNSEAIAYNAGSLIAVQTAWANDAPYDIGFFAHELGHAIQQYGGKMEYKDESWWTEFMADHCRNRYFHWGYSTKFVRFFDYSDKSIYEWNDYEKHGHNLFGVYLDDRWGTKQNEDGTITLGLIDAINKLIKESKVELTDNAYNVNTPFNKVVKEVTGFDCMDDLRLHFAKEIQEGTWRFYGCRDYTDNFLTENIDGIPNPVYPMDEPVAKGDKTAPVLGTPVTEGTNLALGATMVSASAEGGSKNVFANMFDGDLTTKWQAGANKNDYACQLGGYKHEFVIDLGAVKTFDTYTIVNASYNKENKTFNTREWEIFVSEDGTNWTSLDYQKDNTEGIVSVNVGDTSARYVKVRLFATDASSVGTARIYEFMLFDQQ